MLEEESVHLQLSRPRAAKAAHALQHCQNKHNRGAEGETPSMTCTHIHQPHPHPIKQQHRPVLSLPSLLSLCLACVGTGVMCVGRVRASRQGSLSKSQTQTTLMTRVCPARIHLSPPQLPHQNHLQQSPLARCVCVCAYECGCMWVCLCVRVCVRGCVRVGGCLCGCMCVSLFFSSSFSSFSLSLSAIPPLPIWHDVGSTSSSSFLFLLFSLLFARPCHLR